MLGQPLKVRNVYQSFCQSYILYKGSKIPAEYQNLFKSPNKYKKSDS